MKNKLIFPTLNAAETKWDHMKVNNSSKNLFYQGTASSLDTSMINEYKAIGL